MEGEQQPAPDANDQIEERRRSLEQIIQLGFDSYPHRFDRTHSISQIVSTFGDKTAGSRHSAVRVAGRIHASNKMGKRLCSVRKRRWLLGLYQIRDRSADVELFKL
jgi:lysyl-tRNA synthetase class 2